MQYLASFFVSFLVEVQTKATNGRQIVKFKMLAPEDCVGPGFAGGSCVQHVIQTQLTIVAFLSWEVSRFNDPQLEHIVHPSAVVLKLEHGVLLLHYNSPYLHQFLMLHCGSCDEMTDHQVSDNFEKNKIYCIYLVRFDSSLQIFNPFVSL